MKIKIEDLKEGYETISIRVTELEKYFNCAFNLKYGKDNFSNSDALLFGTMMHSVVQSYFYNEKKGLDTLEIMCIQHPERCTNIFEYLKIIDGQMLLSQYNIIASEYKNIIEIEMGKYLLILEGTIDAICKNGDDTYSLIDFKTSKSEWNEDDFNNKMQKIIYTWMFSKLVGEEKIRSFDYLIFTKHKKPRFQQLKYKPDWKHINEFMVGLLNEYVESLSKNIRPSKVAKHCFWCKLKDICPSQMRTSDEF